MATAEQNGMTVYGKLLHYDDPSVKLNGVFMSGGGKADFEATHVRCVIIW